MVKLVAMIANGSEMKSIMVRKLGMEIYRYLRLNAWLSERWEIKDPNEMTNI